MRIRKTPRRIPGNSIGKRDSTTGPIKDIRTPRMADYLKISQRSPKHTRSPRIPASIHPGIFPHRKTTHGTLAKKQNLRMDRTMYGSSKGTYPTDYHTTSPDSPRPRQNF